MIWRLTHLHSGDSAEGFISADPLRSHSHPSNVRAFRSFPLNKSNFNNRGAEMSDLTQHVPLSRGQPCPPTIQCQA